MPIDVDSPLASGFGAAAGVLSGYTAGKQQAEEKRRQDAIDRQNAIAQAAALHHQQTVDAAETDKTAAADRRAGIGITAPDFTPKSVKGKPPVDATAATVTALLHRADWYDQQGATDAAKADRQQAAALLGAAKTQAQTGLIGAQTTETGARTKLLGAEDWQIRIEHPKEFQQKLAATEQANKAALGARYQIARERIQGELERAGMSRSHSGAGADMALQKWIAGENYSTIVKSTLDEYNQQMSDYRTQTAENARAEKFNSENPDSPQEPIINVTMPSAPQQPVIIMTPQGPVVTMPKAPPGGGGTRKPVTRNAAAAPAAPTPTTPAAGGGNPVVEFFQHLLGGGGSAAPAKPAPQTIVGSDGHTYQKTATGWVVVK